MSARILTLSCRNSVEILLFVLDTISKKLYITADNQLIELYVNGISISVGSEGWTTVRTFDIPSSVSSIAVKAIDWGVSGTFLRKSAKTEACFALFLRDSYICIRFK
jgi:hypothetical protein